MCHAWFNSVTQHFIVTAVDVSGKELTWKATRNADELGDIIKQFSGA